MVVFCVTIIQVVTKITQYRPVLRSKEIVSKKKLTIFIQGESVTEYVGKGEVYPYDSVAAWTHSSWIARELWAIYKGNFRNLRGWIRVKYDSRLGAWLNVAGEWKKFQPPMERRPSGSVIH